MLYGDTNSTLAGAIAASKIHVPVIHIEAGLRSFNKKMPEEINRIMCDHASTLLFSPTKTGLNNLVSEGFKPHNIPPYSSDNPGVFHCGDIMFDNSLYFAGMAEKKVHLLENLGVKKNAFLLGTIHRDNNTDEPERLNSIFFALDRISSENNIDIVLPLHPRTSKLLDKNLEKHLLKKIKANKFLKIIPPVSFLEMILLEKYCRIVLTDSGGVQKESYFFEKPCIILRPQTEWTEIVENETAIIADADSEKIREAFNYFVDKTDLSFPPVFGDGKAAVFICNQILNAKVMR